MTLQSAIEAALPELRREALARMTSRCAVMRRTGGMTVVDGFEVPEWAAVYVNLPVRIHGSERSRQVEIAGVGMEIPLRVASFPHDTDDLHDADLVEIMGGDTAGLVFRLVDVDRSDQTTARRVPVVGIERPEEWS